MDKLRVLILCHLYPKPTAPTAGIFVHHQVRHLAGAGCQAVVVAPVPYAPPAWGPTRRWKGYRMVPRDDVRDGVQILYPRYVRPPGRVFRAPAARFLRAGVARDVERLTRAFQPHLLHAQPALPDGYAGLLLSRKLGLPLVVTLRGSDISVYPRENRWTLGQAADVLRGADRVVAVSAALKEEAHTIAEPQRDIHVVYTGCDLERFRFDPDARGDLRARLGIPEGDILFVFVGRVVRTKGLFELINAFSEVAQALGGAWLALVGSGEDAAGVRARAARSGLSDRVIVTGRRPQEEVPQWLSAADVVVHPSWYEGLPNAVVEAMACSRPVVASRAWGIPEAVEDGVSGILVPPGDVPALVEAMLRLGKNEALRARLGTVARTIVEDKFTWRRSAAALAEVYRGVVSGA